MKESSFQGKFVSVFHKTGLCPKSSLFEGHGFQSTTKFPFTSAMALPFVVDISSKAAKAKPEATTKATLKEALFCFLG